MLQEGVTGEMNDGPVQVDIKHRSRQQSAATKSTSPSGTKKASKSVLKTAILVAVAVIIIGALSGWLLHQRSGAAAIDGSKYQAVFFTDGQVYFGKLHTMGGDYLKLTDVYYIQSQDGNDANNPQKSNEKDAPSMQLIKLGSEVHGPEDAMMISKNQVLFFENLKSDGDVAKSIAKYQEQNK